MPPLKISRANAADRLTLKKKSGLTLLYKPEKEYHLYKENKPVGNKEISTGLTKEKQVYDMKNASLRKIIFAALMAALTTVATMIIRIPTPTQGYIHLGDGMVLLCGALLGPGLGALAAGIGSMLSDLFAGYMSYVPGTFVIKALTAMVGGWLYLRLSAGADRRAVPVRVVLSGIPAEAVMVIGYFLYEMGMEVAMGSNAAAAATAVAVGIPMNIVQGVAGIIVCAVLLPVLSLHKGIVTAKNG